MSHLDKVDSEPINELAKRIVANLAEYVNSLDRKHLGMPIKDEIAVMQMEDVVLQTMEKPDKEIEMPSYD